MARRPSRRRRPRPRRRTAPTSEVWLRGGAVAVVLLVVGVIAGIFILRPTPTVRDPDTLCPVSGPSAVTAILVDTTDRLGAISRTDVLARLNEAVEAGAENELFVAFDTGGAPGAVMEPLVEVCHPGHPDEANPLTASPRLIRRRLEERFLDPLGRVFVSLLDRTEADASPLLESVQSTAVTVLARREYEEVPKRLLFITDLMQNTEHLSFFRQPVDYGEFLGSAGQAAVSTDLEGTQVEILFVQRQEHRRLGDTNVLVDFWDRWIADQGGVLRRVVRIDGMN